MSDPRPQVPQPVIDVVKRWGTAPTADAGVVALKAGRLALAAELRLTLCQEVAEICAETLVEVIALEEGVTDGEVVEYEGVPLLPKQAERVSAWYRNQLPIAAALGVEPETWARLLNAGMAALIDGARAGAQAPPSLNAAKRLLGQGAASFENPPAPGTSQRAGLSGILAARRFQSPDRSK